MKPVQFLLIVADEAALAAYGAVFHSGNRVYIEAYGETYVYDATATDALLAEVVLNGPGGIGRWLDSTLHLFGGLYITGGIAPFGLNGVPTTVAGWTNKTGFFRVGADAPTGVVTVQKAGIYQVTLALSGSVSGNGNYTFRAYQNANPIAGAAITRPGSAGAPLGGSAFGWPYLAAGDTLTVKGSTDSGTPTITIADATFEIVRLT